jgi:hypothetical protein
MLVAASAEGCDGTQNLLTDQNMWTVYVLAVRVCCRCGHVCIKCSLV